MKKILFCLGLSVALFAAACSSDPIADAPINGGNGGGNNGGADGGDPTMKYLSVSIDTGARVSVGEEQAGMIPLFWNEGDMLLVNKTTKSSPVAAEYDGKSTAMIGVPASTTYPMTLVYPQAVSKSSAEFFYIATNQPYTGKLANGYAILMGSAQKEGDVVELRHMCGYLKVSLTGEQTIKRVMLRTVGHEAISGFFKYPTTSKTDGKIGIHNFNGDGTLADGYYNSPIVNIDCGEGVMLSSEAKEFYFALPIANYSKGFSLTVVDINDKQHVVTAYAGGKDIQAGTLIEMPALAVNCEEEPGIYNGNELAGYVRTLEKNIWLDSTKTLHLRAEANLSEESFDDIASELERKGVVTRVAGELFYYRADNSDTYNCAAITTLDGHDNAITHYKNTVGNAKAAAVLFHEIPATLTVKNLTLGKSADDADTTLEVMGNGAATTDVNEFVGFCYKLSGTIDNCTNNAKVYVKGTSAGAIYAAGLCGSTSTGTVRNSTNKGYIYCNGATASGEDNVIVAGIVSAGEVVIESCVNEGNITCESCALAGRVAGIIGVAGSQPLTGLKNTGTITLNAPNVGSRIAGVVASTTDATITLCENEGSVVVTGCKQVVHVGGIAGAASSPITSSTNKGAIDVTMTGSAAPYVGGVVGYNNDENSTLEGCVNGELNTAKGAIHITHNGGNNIYAGGVVGNSTKVAAYNGMTNYGSITINGSNVNYVYIGCCGGYTSSAGTTYTNCKNYGDFTLEATSTKTGYNYIGGISGANSNNVVTVSASENYGDMTFNAATMKMRVGGLAGNLGYSGDMNGSRCEFDYTINACAAASNFGGFAGYMPKPSGTAVIENCYYKGTVTNNADVDSTVLIGAVFAYSQASICRNIWIEPTFINNAGSPSFALVGNSASAGLSLTVGGNNKPFRICKNTKFLGISVLSADNVATHSSEEGAAGKAYIDNTPTLANKYAVTMKNAEYNVDYVTAAN